MARPGRRSGRGLFEDAPRKFLFNFLVVILALEFINETGLITQTAAQADGPAMSPSQGWRPVRPMVYRAKVGISVAARQHRQKKLYSSPSAMSSLHPPISAPSYSSISGASDLSFYSSDQSDHYLVQHNRRSAADVTAHVDAAPPDAASNTSDAPSGLVQPPVSPHDGCCAPNMVQRRGSKDCHCVYPVRVELLLHNVSLNSNWSNEFLDELASQLNLRVTQFEIVNFYVVGASGLNMAMDIAPHTGNSFSSEQVTAMNYSLSMHTVRINPILVGDYNLLNFTWFRPLAPAPDSKGINTKIILIVTTSAAASLLFPCMYFLIWHRKGKQLWLILCKKTSSTTEKNYEAMIVSYGSLAPKRYMYSEVTKITSSRSDQLGRGGYGVVFKGRLHDGRLVAVKFLHDCKGNGDEFVNEVMSIGRTSHVNVVSLHGFCLEGSKRALIYEYMPNGSLDKYIYSENPKQILGWERLYAIAIGIAHGLEYLHHSCNTRIVHFDIKPQNILLDKDFIPKIADFGLAKLCHTKESKLSMTGARGTIGFIAPEVHSRTFGMVSTKSDVYSYGMMLLEMVGGRRNVKSIVEKSSEKYFPDWIYDHLAQDDGLQACEVTEETEEIARKMILIGLWCIQVIPLYRPTITKVLEMFERSLDDLDMPPKQSFCELLESSAHNLDVQSASSIGSEEISLVGSKKTTTTANSLS